MEPIINPWWFYWMEIANTIRVIAFVISFISGIITTFCCIDTIGTSEEKDGYSPRKLLKFILKIFIPACIILTFTPSSDTMMKMLVADNTTPNNLEIVGDTIEEGVDYIFEKINLVVEESRD